MKTFLVHFIYYISLAILLYFIFLWLSYVFFLLSSCSRIFRKFEEFKFNDIYKLLNKNPFIPITIIIPTYNEQGSILNTLESILKNNYSHYHLIIVNDGSTDQTLERLKEQYALYPVPPVVKQILLTGKVRQYYRSKTIKQMLVIDKEHSPFSNSGADSINAGLNACRTPVYLTLDADTIVEPNTLTTFLFSYLTNAHCIAIGGAVYIINDCIVERGELKKVSIPKHWVSAVLIPEYLRSFLYGREGWSLLGGALCFPGALTFFETQAVLEVGGYDARNFAYDAEMTMKLHHFMRKKKYPYQLVFNPNAQGWTDQPETISSLWEQRYRWQRGLMRCICNHKGMFLNPVYGVVGLLGFPVFIALEIFSTVLEACAYLVFLLALFVLPAPTAYLGWFMLLAWGFSILTTLVSLLLEVKTRNRYKQKLNIWRIITLSSIDFLGFRQVRAFACLFGTIHYLINRLLGKSQ